MYTYSLAEPFIKPTLHIKPSSNITEGKEIRFECSTVVAKMRDIEIILLIYSVHCSGLELPLLSVCLSVHPFMLLTELWVGSPQERAV